MNNNTRFYMNRPNIVDQEKRGANDIQKYYCSWKNKQIFF